MIQSVGKDADDPWLLRSTALLDGATAGLVSRVPALRIVRLPQIVPLDSQLGMAMPKTVPEGLKAVLFGQLPVSDVGADLLHTYAVVEAARVRHLPEILTSSDLTYRCIFKGEAFDSFKEVAPWLVQLREDDSFTRNLFTRSSAHWHRWDDEPAVYIRSRASIDQLWQHLRKFTRIRDEHGRWFYFRFWEPKWAEALLATMEPADQARFMAMIDAFIVPQKDSGTAIISFRDALQDAIFAQLEGAS